MSAAALLDRLNGVRQTGPGRWLAKCPAHDDRNPSLSVRECDDGMTLVRCWSGCEFSDIVSAAGLRPADLFPPKPLPTGTQSQRGYSRPFPAADVLAAVAGEAVLVAVTARDIINGEALTEPDVQRLWLASGRLLEAARCANV